jgi:hypothetical protein
MTIQIRSRISFGEEVSRRHPVVNFLRHIKETYEYERDISQAKFTAIYLQVSLFCYQMPLLVTSRGLVDESGMIRTHMETHNRSVIVVVLGTGWAIPPRKGNSNHIRKIPLPVLILSQINLINAILPSF